MTNYLEFAQIGESFKPKIFGGNDSNLWDLGYKLIDLGFMSRTLRGDKMRTAEGLFDEFAAAFQFPGYFGRNWNAFDECLGQMDYVDPGKGIVILIYRPDELLADDPKDRTVFSEVLTDLSEEYSKAINFGEWSDRPALPFHVVFHAPPDQPNGFISVWEKTGLEFVKLEQAST